MIEYATYKVWGGCSAPYNLESGGRLIGQRVYSAPSSERTCRITDEEPIEIPDQDPWYGMLDTGITRYKLSCGHDTLSEDCDGPKRCCECGAAVVEA